MAIKLTQTDDCGGCAAKINPIDLFSLIENIPTVVGDRISVDFRTGDDACIYNLEDSAKSLVFTTDFISPIVDDPFDYGRIAAVNALSDIYAMGGTPILALNIVCFNEALGFDVLNKILEGGSQVCLETNTALCGGHTVKNSELRYGMAVIGTVDPKKVITNSNGASGDILYLTKPLGTGILSQALKNNLLPESGKKLLTDQLCELNDKVAIVMQKLGLSCATDITGFGFVGHLLKLLQSSKCSAEVEIERIPYLPDSLEYASNNVYSSSLEKNKVYVENFLTGAYKGKPQEKLLFDPQTSGGMLICVQPEKKSSFEKEMKRNNLRFYRVGKLLDSDNLSIKIN